MCTLNNWQKTWIRFSFLNFKIIPQSHFALYYFNFLIDLSFIIHVLCSDFNFFHLNCSLSISIMFGVAKWWRTIRSSKSADLFATLRSMTRITLPLARKLEIFTFTQYIYMSNATLIKNVYKKYTLLQLSLQEWSRSVRGSRNIHVRSNLHLMNFVYYFFVYNFSE